MKVRMLHNPRCSKSRQCLQLLQEQGVETEVVNILEHTPSQTELAWLWQRLGSQMLRADNNPEQDSKPKSLQDNLEAMEKNPSLIQRPIVIMDEKVVLARPPEKVLELFK